MGKRESGKKYRATGMFCNALLTSRSGGGGGRRSEEREKIVTEY
jgi:hypothetical protein